MRSPIRNLALAILVAGAAVYLLVGSDRWSARGAPRPLSVAPEEASAPPVAEPPPVATPAEERGGDVPSQDPVAVFDSDEVTRLLAFLLDPANREEAHVDERGQAANDLAAIVERGGLPLEREAARRMQDRDPTVRRRAQLLLALAKEVPEELLADLRGSADPLVSAYPELRARWHREPDSEGNGGGLGDAPLLDVADDVRRRLWPDPEPAEGVWNDDALPAWPEIRNNLRSWWQQVPAEDRFLVADDELIVVARDVANTWVHHNWRFVMLLKRRDGHWHVASFFRPSTTNEIFRRVLVADLDGDGHKEAAVWMTTIAGWCWGQLAVVGSGAPDGAVTRNVYGGAEHIRLVPPRSPGDPVRFGVCDLHLPSNTGKWGYVSGVIARACDLLEWTGTGFRSVGTVFVPSR